MKMSVLLNVFLAVAVGVLAVKVFMPGESENSASNQVLDNIMTRTSVRAYEDKPVEEAKVEQMLRAAMAAPTAINKQPWDFVIVDDPVKLKELADSLPNARMVAKAPLAIVVCGNFRKTIEGDGHDNWIADASAATENLLLAAHSLGLGAVWTGVYPSFHRVGIIQEVLNLPDHIVPLSLVPIGYPAETPQPKDKWNPDNVHRNGWNPAY